MPVTSGLYWERFGDPANPALLLSAGLGGVGAYWKANLAALAEQRCVYLYDHRGTGRSARKVPTGMTADDLAADVELVMDSAGIKQAVVIGHAAGAVAGLALGLGAPERLAGLVLVNGWAKADPHFRRCIEMRLAVLRGGGPEAFVRAQPVFLYPPAWVSQNDALLDAQLSKQVEEFQGEQTLRARINALLNFDIAERLGEIPVQTLVVGAEDDFLVPCQCSQTLSAGLPYAEIAMISAGGHACNLTHPETFNGIVRDWLSRAGI